MRRSQTKEPTRWLANLNGRFGAWPLESENANSSSSPGNCLSRLLWSRGYVEHRQVLAAIVPRHTQHESVVLQTILIMLARHQNNNAWFSSIQPRKVLNGLSTCLETSLKDFQLNCRSSGKRGDFDGLRARVSHRDASHKHWEVRRDVRPRLQRRHFHALPPSSIWQKHWSEPK